MTVYLFNRDDKSKPIVYAECSDCGGHEQIENIKYARNFVCDECLLENDQKEIEQYV